MKVILYTRRSTDRQDASHPVQVRALRSEARQRGWKVAEHVKDDCSGSVPLAERAGGGYALALLARGEADALAVWRLDRLSRSALDFASTVQRALDEGWALVCLNPSLDLSTPSGRMTAQVIMAVAEYERELLVERTREGLAEARSRGREVGGPAVPDAVVARIVREREGGASLPAIAKMLAAEGVPTARGGRWHPSTVRAVLRRAERDRPTA